VTAAYQREIKIAPLREEDCRSSVAIGLTTSIVSNKWAKPTIAEMYGDANAK
jgi:hypothetical protein